jgi:hypothetical protein
LRSGCRNVFLAFFFFLGWALVVAHRIVWYGVAVNRGTSTLAASIEDVVSLLKGAINDRGCAIGRCAAVVPQAIIPKVRSEMRECQGALVMEGLHVFTISSIRFLFDILATFITLCKKAIGTPYLMISNHAHQG